MGICNVFWLLPTFSVWPASRQLPADQPVKRGITLKQGMPILFEIAELFTNMDEVTALAVYLLEGIGKGGREYVRSLKDSKSSPKDSAHDVLEHWCAKKPTAAFGGELLRVLERKAVSPRAAEDFRSQLLPVGGE